MASKPILGVLDTSKVLFLASSSLWRLKSPHSVSISQSGMSFASYHANSVAPAVMQTLVPLQTEPPEANLRVCISVLKDLSPRTTSMRDTLLWAGMTSVSTIKDGIQMTLKSEEFQRRVPVEASLLESE